MAQAAQQSNKATPVTPTDLEKNSDLFRRVDELTRARLLRKELPGTDPHWVGRVERLERPEAQN